MHAETDTTPATAHPLEAIDTGAGAEATTRPKPSPETLQAFALARIAHLEASAQRCRAEAAEALAHAAAHRADPYHAAPERIMLAELAENRARNAENRANAFQFQADQLRAEQPAAPSVAIPMAVIVINVLRDRVTETAHLTLGGNRSASRSWTRTGAGSWTSRDREWPEHENRLGVELCEYLEGLDFPSRVAAMLPRPPAPESDAARKAAAEVARA